MADDKPEKGNPPKGRGPTIQPAQVNVTSEPMRSWLVMPYAERWYEDALREARSNPPDTNARRDALRREIIFAVCFAESFLIEQAMIVMRWPVGEDPTSPDHGELERFFPAGDKRGIKDRWKETWKTLWRCGELDSEPDFGGSEWRNFRELVDFRDGLVHARASRPATRGQTDDDRPYPSPGDLDRKPCGFAVKCVYDLVMQVRSCLPPETGGYLPTEPPEPGSRPAP